MWQRSPSWLSARAWCRLGGPGSHTAAPGWKTAGVVGRARCFPDVSTSGSIRGRRWRRRLAGADVQAASSVVKASRLVLALCLPPESTATGPERGITSHGGQKPLFYVKPSCPGSLSPQGTHPASSPWLLVARSPAPAPFQQGQCQPGPRVCLEALQVGAVTLLAVRALRCCPRSSAPLGGSCGRLALLAPPTPSGPALPALRCLRRFVVWGC